MRLATIKEKAELFGLPWKIATYHRVRYLREHLKTLAAEMDWYETYATNAEDSGNRQVSIMGFWHTLDTFIATGKELRALTQAIKGEERKGDITDDQINEAKQYPVDRLIEFKNGKALAFCHDDTTPSLTFLSRKRIAWCPVCNLYFDAIEILRRRDSYSFRSAVQLLNGRL